MSNSFKLHPKHYSKGAKNFPAPPIYGHALRANCAPVSTPSSPDKPISVISVKSPQRKEMTFDRRLKTLGLPVVFGLYCSSSQTVIKIFAWIHGK